MNKYQEELLESLDLLVEEKLKKTPYNRYEYGKIISDLGNNIYTVEINEQSYDIHTEGHKANIGDIVTVSIPNGDFSKKFIRTEYKNISVGWEKIYDILLPSITAQVDFTGLSGYKTYKLILNGLSNNTSSVNLLFRVNDITSGYTNYNYVMTSTNVTTVATSFALYNVIGSSSVNGSSVEITIINNGDVEYQAHSSTSTIPTFSLGKLNGTVNINKLSFFLSSSKSFTEGSKFILLGLK